MNNVQEFSKDVQELVMKYNSGYSVLRAYLLEKDMERERISRERLVKEGKLLLTTN